MKPNGKTENDSILLNQKRLPCFWLNHFLVVPMLKQTFRTPLGWVITLTKELNRMRRYKVTKGWKNKILMIIHWESVKHSGSQILHQKKYLYLHHQLMMVNPRTYTHTPTVVKYGRGGVLNPSLEFFIYCSNSKKITLSGKPLNFSKRWSIYYGWWRYWRPVPSPNMVAILAAILDFMK